jgi:hypothetical protein
MRQNFKIRNKNRFFAAFKGTLLQKTVFICNPTQDQQGINDYRTYTNSTRNDIRI